MTPLLASKLCPFPRLTFPLGLYELPRRSGEAHLYRLAIRWPRPSLRRPRAASLPVQEVRFRLRRPRGHNLHLGSHWREQSGWLTVSTFTVESLDQAEDHLFLAATTDAGAVLDEEAPPGCSRCPAKSPARSTSKPPARSTQALVADNARPTSSAPSPSAMPGSSRPRPRSSTAGPTTSSWASNARSRRLTARSRKPAAPPPPRLTLEEKLAGQKQIKALESQRNEKRRSLFEAQDKVDEQRETLIATIEGKLTQNASSSDLFTIRWRLA